MTYRKDILLCLSQQGDAGLRVSMLSEAFGSPLYQRDQIYFSSSYLHKVSVQSHIEWPFLCSPKITCQARHGWLEWTLFQFFL